MHVELLRSSHSDFFERSGRSLDFFLLRFFVSRQKNEVGFGAMPHIQILEWSLFYKHICTVRFWTELFKVI